MCGILAIAANSTVNQLLYEGLTVLQHRGQDAAGIATCDDSRIFLKKSNGLVRDVFQADDMIGLPGNMGVGHVRYPTAGNSSTAEAQPFYVNSPYGITLAHNGNLINSEKLKTDLFDDELRHINTDSDSEVLLNVFAQELHKLNKKKIIVELLKPLEKKYSMMGSFRRRGTSTTVLQYNNKYENNVENEDNVENVSSSSCPNTTFNLENVREYFDSRGFVERYADHFYYHYKSLDWLNKNGVDIRPTWRNFAEQWFCYNENEDCKKEEEMDDYEKQEAHIKKLLEEARRWG